MSTCWSAENATKAYLTTLKMGKRDKEADIEMAEFISALAAGNNSKLMVVACSEAADSTTLVALVAAAQQTDGRVICIFPGLEQLSLSKFSLGKNSKYIEFVSGEAQNLLLNEYIGADFLLIDCKIRNHEEILRGLNKDRNKNKYGIILGYNAFRNSSWKLSGIKAQLLPIGEGLLVIKRAENGNTKGGDCGFEKSHWVVKVDEFTGEEHVFRIRLPKPKSVKA